jgi:hypothetical protein
LPFVDKSFRDRPLIEARLRLTLGQSFYYLGQWKIAADQYLTARAIYTKHLGPDHPDTLWSMNGLAWTLSAASDAKLRDPPRAVELAAKATELEPENANHWGTLGTARYRNAD